MPCKKSQIMFYFMLFVDSVAWLVGWQKNKCGKKSQKRGRIFQAGIVEEERKRFEEAGGGELENGELGGMEEWEEWRNGEIGD